MINEQKKEKFSFLFFPDLINGWMILAGEKKKERATNCLCHSNKTAHSQINRKEKKNLSRVLMIPLS